LIRVEVEFDNESQAMDFEPYHWFGQEITESVLWRDSSLFDLSDADFQKMLLATSWLSMGFM
jgi:CYTH domain-containing protein